MCAGAVLRKKPQSAGDLSVGKELPRELDDAINMIVFHQCLSDGEAGGLAIGKLTRRHDESCRTSLSEVV